LDPELANQYWRCAAPAGETASPEIEALFQARLLDNMHDAVAFIDQELHITQWNHGAERLTGIAAASVSRQPWLPSLLSMRDEKGQPVADIDCPVAFAIRSGVQSLRRLTIRGRTGEPVSVDSHIIPVAARNGKTFGAVLLMHDASPEASLEERCQNLHEKATKDPMTQVANRAEFDRVHDMFVIAHRQHKVPCSLLICDLDHFKRVNDTYGHQAGDEAIKSLASLLKSACRPGDLVARYGGEEFVMLFADCDNATAARRAEQIRKALAQIAQPKLDGRPVTASFGVTEIQPGDTPETMLRRADRALLMAKSKGRNCVVQLGSGTNDDGPGSWCGFWGRRAEKPVVSIEQDLQTSVPLKVAIEKLRGFVADHEAKILKIDGGKVLIELEDNQPSRQRRRADRPTVFLLDLRFEEEHFEKSGRSDNGASGVSRTNIHVIISPKPRRDRRRLELQERAKEVLTSFRSYLIATQVEAPSGEGTWRRVSRILTPWLIRRS
jgi:diguanylate cyclase (GGDEF)-like protein